jgi:tetratricopeptide (TPR) repeat protein
MQFQVGFYFLIVAAAFCCAAPVRAQQPNPSPREQLTQYVADFQKNPSDDDLRGKIIKLALTLDPKPATPPEVDELAGRGKYILDHASSDGDFAAAADAFAKASLLAPWVPDYYFDQASMLEKSKRYKEAVNNYELYLMAAPDAQDAKDVREKIGGLKYEIEKRQSADAAAQAQQQAEIEAERARKQAAEQAREEQEREEQQRLANLDPLVRSSNGAVYQTISRMGTVPESFSTTTYTVAGDRVVYKSVWRNSDGGILDQRDQTYLIDGQHFFMQAQDTARCQRYFGTDACGFLGTITPGAITFQTAADGRPVRADGYGYAQDAKRVK